jgi:hypothetical protein
MLRGQSTLIVTSETVRQAVLEYLHRGLTEEAQARIAVSRVADAGENRFEITLDEVVPPAMTVEPEAVDGREWPDDVPAGVVQQLHADIARVADQAMVSGAPTIVTRRR